MEHSHSANADLHSLLSHDPITTWAPIYKRIKDTPHEVKVRYYRNESCLQLALRAKEFLQPCALVVDVSSLEVDGEFDKKLSQTNRIDVLRAILKVDPDVVHWRDDEGRTPLHTACSAGRSFEVLQLLLDEEKQLRVEGIDLNATLRTDFPGGSLPLHTIAACSTFDGMYFQENSHTDDASMYSICMKQIQSCPISIKITPNVLSAYASTATIIEAYPKAVLEKDCEGELPLHSAASFGNIGSVLALLNASDYQGSIEAALCLNDRQKSPLSCACERVVAFSVHKKNTLSASTEASAKRRGIDYLRVSIDRDDPFEGWDMSVGRTRVRTRGTRRSNYNLDSRENSYRGRSLRGSLTRHGSSYRSSLSTSFVLSGGRFGLDGDQPNNENSLRLSFTSTRRPLHPVFGLEKLDCDGEEEFAKVELLTMAACGFFAKDNSAKSGNPFHFIHELIKLDQQPELIWHAARHNPLEVTTKDASGCVPLHLACARLVREAKAFKDGHLSEGSFDGESHSGIRSFDAGQVFVESFFLGKSHRLPEPFFPNENSGREQSDECDVWPKTQSISNAPQHQFSESIEIINMLLYSQEFGSKQMASEANNQGRLPIHIILEAIPWNDAGDEETPHPIKSLIDSNPRALETKCGLTGLYPFMLAAAATYEDNLSVVETTYRLLVTFPSVIALFS